MLLRNLGSNDVRRPEYSKKSLQPDHEAYAVKNKSKVVSPK